MSKVLASGFTEFINKKIENDASLEAFAVTFEKVEKAAGLIFEQKGKSLQKEGFP